MTAEVQAGGGEGGARNPGATGGGGGQGAVEGGPALREHPSGGAGALDAQATAPNGGNPQPVVPPEQPPKPSFLNDAPWGAIVVISGLVAIVIIFVVAIGHYKEASDVATATASISGVIAALVGAYFGIRGSSMAQEKAEKGHRSGGPGAGGPQ
jgi:energy-converting hydrogenase Eha subunit A